MSPYRTFNPLAYGTPIHAFWAEDAAALAVGDGNDVTSWTNHGSDGTAATGSVGVVPTLAVDGINGRPALAFDGVDNVLQIADTATATTTQTITYVCVVHATSIANGERFMAGSSTTSSLRTELLYATGPLVHMYSGTSQSGDAGSASTADPFVYVAVFNGASSFCRANGVQVLTGDAGSNSLDGLSLGAANTGSTNFFHGNMGHAAVYDSDITTEDWFAEYEQGLINHYTVTPAARGYQPYLGKGLGPYDVLLVSDTTDASGTYDGELKTILESLGHTVTVVQDTAAAVTEGHDIVVIGPECSSTSLYTPTVKYADGAYMPCVCFDYSHFDDYGFSDTSWSSNSRNDMSYDDATHLGWEGQTVDNSADIVITTSNRAMRYESTSSLCAGAVVATGTGNGGALSMGLIIPPGGTTDIGSVTHTCGALGLWQAFGHLNAAGEQLVENFIQSVYLPYWNASA